ncbi:MAG: endonuclease/exonuclease/phosphatase family protein [Pseudomonadota bacterium]
MTGLRYLFLSTLALAIASPTAMAQDLSKPENSVRIATFNASLSRQEAGRLLKDLQSGTDQQIANVVATIQAVQPDILLINEFDFDPTGQAYTIFADKLSTSGGSPAWPMGLVHAGPSNTGVPSGRDLDGDGEMGGPADAIGFGFFEGQYAMALFSRHSTASDHLARTFQRFLWRDLPAPGLPDKEPGSGAGDFYDGDALAVLRLSSKSHWDIPVALPDGRVVHILASHPTPPVFDGPEDRNGRRNAAEIRFWSGYVQGGPGTSVLTDDAGTSGGLPLGASFAILGDLNNDPEKGDGDRSAMTGLISLSEVQDPAPASKVGGTDTADFRNGPLRVDYVLPSADLTVVGSGVFWPEEGDPHFELIGEDGQATSDHRLVWVDIALN